MARKKATAEELRRMNKAREFKRKRNMLKAAGAGHDNNKGESVCAICDDGGDLTCCEGCCQRSFHLDDQHNCIKALGLTVQEAKNIIQKEVFICNNCQYKQHQCFICGSLGSSDDTSSQAEVFQCEHDDCAHFYHPKCVAQMLYPDSKHRQELFELHVAAGEGFSCPMHECIVCKEVENKTEKGMQFAVCRRCPTVYHRKCLPSDILFQPKKGPKGAMRRAWKNMLPADRILIFCMKHEIVRKLQTPARNHIIFPETNAVKTFEAAPMEQDMPDQKEAPDHSSPEQTPNVVKTFQAAPMEQDMPDQKEAPDYSSPEQTPNVVKTFEAAPMEQDMPDEKEASDHSSPEQTPNVVKTFQAAPMEQEMPDQKEAPDDSSPEQTPNVVKTFQAAPMEQEMPDQKEAPDDSSPEQIHSSPPPAASDRNQCCCSSPFDSFAPSSLFMHPYPGSCGWLDD